MSNVNFTMCTMCDGPLALRSCGISLRPNSITLSWWQTGPKLVDRKPAANWNLAYHISELARAIAGLRPA